MMRFTKYLVLIISVIMGNIIHSQSQNSINSFYIELKNSSGEYVENAEVYIDSIKLDYDKLKNKYIAIGEFNENFTIKAFCEGYDTLNYKSEEIPYSLKSKEVSIYLYLIRPGDKYYYYDKLLKIPYKPRPNELLVVLKPKENIITDNDIVQFENSIKKNGLVVYKTFLAPPTPNSIEYMKYRSLSPSIKKQVIVKKQDGTNFDTDSCVELAFLRQLEQVNYAGPLIMTEDSYLGAITYNHFIKLDYPLKSLNITTLNNLLKEIDERYYFDEKNNRIVLPPETNENIPQIMGEIYDSGIDESLSMTFMKFVRSAGVCPSQSFESVSSDTLESIYLNIGGKKMLYNKDLSRIGIVFESNYSDYFTFTTKYNLTHDNQHNYRNFTVFRFTENLTIDKREEIMKSIKEEKHVKIVGDLLIWNRSASIITEQIMVRWEEATTDSEKIKKFIEKEELEEISQHNLLNATILKVQSPYNYRVVEVCNKLMKSGLVTFAEPDLYSPIELD